MKITVLFTACCGWPTCGTVLSLGLFSHFGNWYRCVGVDLCPDDAALNYLDAVYEAPRCDDPSYVPFLLDICQKEDVDVVVPLISDELDVLHDGLGRFRDAGVAVLMSGDDALLDIANDKMALESFLLSNGVDVMPKSIQLDPSSVWESLSRLGYPQFPVCVKMARGCGSSGFNIVEAGAGASCALSTSRASRGRHRLSGEQLAEAASVSDCSPFILQEYLPGPEHTALCFYDHGRLLYSPSCRCDEMQFSTVTSCELVDDGRVTSIAERVGSLLGLDGNVGLDLREGPDGDMRLIDVNPRVSATVSLVAHAGLNLVELGVVHALGSAVPEDVPIEFGMRLRRNYGTMYSKDGEARGLW